MPDPIISDQTQVASPPPTFPEMADIPTMPQASGPIDIPPVITEPKIPKKKSGRMIATILGIFLLVGAVGAGVILVGQKQLFKQKADNSYICRMCMEDCLERLSGPGEDQSRCDGLCDTQCNSGGSETGGSAKVVEGNVNTNTGVTCTAGALNTTGQCCNDGHMQRLMRNDNCTTYTDCGGPACAATAPTAAPMVAPTIAPTVAPPGSNCTETCITDHLDENGYCGSTGNQYWCQKVIGDYGVLKSCLGGSCNSTYTYSSGEYCLDTQHGRNCDAGVRCSTSPDSRCAGGTPITTSAETPTTPPGDTSTTTTSTPTLPPTPTMPPGTAQCVAVKAYDTDWILLNSTQLSALKVGDKVRFTISGNPAGQIDKARFTINGVLGPEVITKKPGTDEYYTEYTIPAGVTSFTVTAQVHHLTLGWF